MQDRSAILELMIVERAALQFLRSSMWCALTHRISAKLSVRRSMRTLLAVLMLASSGLAARRLLYIESGLQAMNETLKAAASRIPAFEIGSQNNEGHVTVPGQVRNCNFNREAAGWPFSRPNLRYCWLICAIFVIFDHFTCVLRAANAVSEPAGAAILGNSCRKQLQVGGHRTRAQSVQLQPVRN
jgi:hypothetical protein